MFNNTFLTSACKSKLAIKNGEAQKRMTAENWTSRHISLCAFWLVGDRGSSASGSGREIKTLCGAAETLLLLPFILISIATGALIYGFVTDDFSDALRC